MTIYHIDPEYPLFVAGTHILFREYGTSKSGKTQVWLIETKSDSLTLGHVAWFSRWRKYVFLPMDRTVFEQTCLREIADFCEQQTTLHRKRKKKTMTPKIRVYVAGPYTTGDPVANARKALTVAERLSDLGFVPFVPHLYLLWDFLYPHGYEFWMEIDNDWLHACHCLLRIPGESKGADREIVSAKEGGLPVFYSVEELVLAISKGVFDHVLVPTSSQVSRLS